MAVKSYIIAPFNQGIESDLRPWMIPEQAFEDLEDAYTWRGRIRKRVGYSLLGSTSLLSRLRVLLGTTNGSGNLSGTVPGAIFDIGQLFSIGTEIYTVVSTGTPANLLDTGSTATATYNTTTGAYVFAGAPINTEVFFYPANPVMGLLSRDTTTANIQDLVAFDTQFAYQFDDPGFSRLGTTTWTGSDTNFFWGINYRGSTPDVTNFYVVNYNPTDGIAYIPAGGSSWTVIKPQLNSTGTNRFLETALIIINFKDRLLALNTIESNGGVNSTYVNRVRYSQNGDPTASNGWVDDTPGLGGFIDAPTKDFITTAEIVKDRLIVYFQNTTWELAYTGDATLPFRWQQINNELGCESPNSVIGFDEFALGIGNRGIHLCDGLNVKRIDEKIPDLVWSIHNNSSGVLRTYGIRDYFLEMVFWTFPGAMGSPTYPTQILAYNYRTATFSLFNESFTCFGYLQMTSDLTWAGLTARYGTWENWNDPWALPINQAAFPFVIAGNQEGFVFLTDEGKSSNAPSLQITNMTPVSSQLKVINHNLFVNDYVLINGCVGITSLNGIVVQIRQVVDANTVVIDTAFAGTYKGGGTLQRVSNINILTKQFNPGSPIGQQFSFPYVDINFDTTSLGQLSFDYLLNTISGEGIWENAVDGALLGSNIVSTAPESFLGDQSQQNQIWHRIYLQAQGQMIQLRFYLSDAQMRNLPIATSDMQLNGMILYAQPAGRLIGG